MEEKTRKLVFVSSPLRGDFKKNEERARMFCKWVMLKHGAIPIAPHVIFTQWLDDDCFEEQQLGLEAGFDLLKICDEIWVFCKDEAQASPGMKLEIGLAQSIGKPLKLIDPEIALNDIRAFSKSERNTNK